MFCLIEEIGLEKVTMIVELSQKGVFRPDIAKNIGISPSTVYKYQKRFHLI